MILIAEDHSGWDAVTQPTDDGGLGFDAAWYADFYHHLIGDAGTAASYARLLKAAGFGDDRPLAMGRSPARWAPAGATGRLPRVARRGGQRRGHAADDRRRR